MYYKIEIKGLVQGVGFRPFIYNLAIKMRLKGVVLNNSLGVLIKVVSSKQDIEKFVKEIQLQKPKQSYIESIEIKEIENSEIFNDFQIKESQNKTQLSTQIPSDMAMCQECKDELEDKNNRRYNYPFINCINCGPRFSIIKNLPYDREYTSMDKFTLCKECLTEYQNPKDRRYHAQPIGCSQCGPQLSLFQDNEKLPSQDIIGDIANFIKNGKIIAIKSVGGYHLVCDSTNSKTIKHLREYKQRPSKPFAVMVKDLKNIENIAYYNNKERELLSSYKAPIVLLEKSDTYNLSPLIAPKTKQIGIFLSPSPLYHLLLQQLEFPIIATSANLCGEPICFKDKDIFELSNIWDYLLIYNRDIVNSSDDSVVFVENNQEFILRNARGYSPTYLKLPKDRDKKILSLGANQKSSVAIGVDNQVILSPYIGDLNSVKSIEYFKSHINLLKKIYQFEPDVIVCDKHPNYESTKYAYELKKQNPNIELIQVQHHYAHILATMGVNNISTKVLGISFDGTGYGDDGTLWGGEFFICDLESYERVGHFKTFKLLGGEKAIKEPRRVALSFLFELYGEDVLTLSNSVTNSFTTNELKTLYIAWKKNLNVVLSSSVGRIFDGVASLIDIVQVCSYDGESGLLLESFYDDKIDGSFEFTIDNNIIDFSLIVKQILQEKSSIIVVSKFFNTLVEIIYKMGKKYNLPIVLSGGVFQNRVLVRLIMKKVPDIIIAKNFLSNDGAIAYGQMIGNT